VTASPIRLSVPSNAGRAQRQVNTEAIIPTTSACLIDACLRKDEKRRVERMNGMSAEKIAPL
jgi:hypothetical protein